MFNWKNAKYPYDHILLKKKVVKSPKRTVAVLFKFGFKYATKYSNET